MLPAYAVPESPSARPRCGYDLVHLLAACEYAARETGGGMPGPEGPSAPLGTQLIIGPVSGSAIPALSAALREKAWPGRVTLPALRIRREGAPGGRFPDRERHSPEQPAAWERMTRCSGDHFRPCPIRGVLNRRMHRLAAQAGLVVHKQHLVSGVLLGQFAAPIGQRGAVRVDCRPRGARPGCGRPHVSSRLRSLMPHGVWGAVSLLGQYLILQTPNESGAGPLLRHRVLPAGLRRSGGSADSVRGCPCGGPPGCPCARTYSGQRRWRGCWTAAFAPVSGYMV